jgi:hypothetical protein
MCPVQDVTHLPGCTQAEGVRGMGSFFRVPPTNTLPLAHSSIGYVSPAEAERRYRERLALPEAA